MGFEILVMVAALGFWLFAEFKLTRGWRVGSGILVAAVAGVVCYYIAGFVPEIESFRHRRAMKHMAEALSVGDTNRVEQAIRIYNAFAVTGDTYQASSAMLQILEHE